MKLRQTLALLCLTFACTSEPTESPDAGLQCAPGDCSPWGAECGTLVQEGKCYLCGECMEPETCGGGGRARQCGCTPKSCDQVTCGQIDPGCGLGLPVLDCGCTGPETCGGSGVPGLCGSRVGRRETCDASSASRRTCQLGLSCCQGRGEAPDICLETCEPTPDLVVFRPPANVAQAPRFFPPEDCSYVSDRCVYATGDRQLLYFEIGIANLGTQDLDLGRPGDDPNRFSLDTCTEHVHYHFPGFLRQRLLTLDGQPVPQAPETPKLGWCLRDTDRVTAASSPTPRFRDDDPATGYTTSCVSDPQGISTGWMDVYNGNDHCQWIDVTEVPPGDYKIEVTVNADHSIPELTYDNNIVTATVTVQ